MIYDEKSYIVYFDDVVNTIIYLEIRNNTVNSHILLPKVVLKHFVGASKKFYKWSLDVEYINQSTPKSFNTQEDHYSKFVENLLEKNVETNLGKVIIEIEKQVLEIQRGINYTKIRNVLLQYLYSLLARSPDMLKEVQKELFFGFLFTEQSLHDVAVIESMALMNESKLFEEYEVAIIVNETEIPFVLPNCGVSDTAIDNEGKMFFMPITNKICILFIENNYAYKYFYNGAMIIQKASLNFVKQINNLAFYKQKELGWGSLICSNKQELQRLKGLLK